MAMEGARARMGTVTSLESIFPVEEAQKAVKRVQDAILEKQKELEHLKGFIAENTSLVSLVQRLPEELHHDVMVPFGKAAFFPGRLIHTNEFLVLLGEGYYAERTSKQTIEILKRRGELLDSQVVALKANIVDLKAEASFFDATASEAAEGLVEIREDYAEESSTEVALQSDKHGSPETTETVSKKIVVGDEEFAKMMSRLDELEKEELAAESNNESDHGVQPGGCPDLISDQSVPDHDIRHVKTEGQLSKQPLGLNNMHETSKDFLNEIHQQQDLTHKLKAEGLTVQSEQKDTTSTGKSLARDVKESSSSVKSSMLPFVNTNSESASSVNEALRGSLVERSEKAQTNPREENTSQDSTRTSKPEFDSSKAFTGTIVERTHNLKTNTSEPSTSQSTSSVPSKPVSRFKAQRR